MAEQIKHFEILKKPLVTEKTIKLYQEENKVVIDVDVKADRSEIKRAFETAFPGTKVEKVNIIVSNPRTKRKGRFIAKIGKKKKAIIKLSKDSNVDIYGMDFE
ncbi:large subunit ribosomal protein L23 [Bacilli bacterium PM5-3]|nr:large subunit ribosomal protein L23 [Bacilli bacterium PM5-3]MDH6604186.1 large subunit ribosomal protein L23 [Bacilli bacterium PM5-9]